METPTSPQTQADLSHLKLLSIFHFIMIVLALIGAGFYAVHYTVMSSVFNNPEMIEKMRQSAEQQHQPGPPFDPAQFFHYFIWFYILAGLWSFTSLILNAISGFCLRSRTNRMFSLIVAGFNCINIPFGTVLGIFTIIVLVRPSVIALYQNPKSV